jgi:putative ABC transport system substrate-binding protein
VAVLVSPANANYAEATLNEVGTSARSMGLQIQVLKASTIPEINAAFATFAGARPHALFVGHDPFFNSRRTQLVQLAARYAIPASYSARDFAVRNRPFRFGLDLCLNRTPSEPACYQCGSRRDHSSFLSSLTLRGVR